MAFLPKFNLHSASVNSVIPTDLQIDTRFSTECEEGTFGQNCSSPCHCLNDRPCDHINGSCPNNLCAPGWKSNNCSTGSFKSTVH